MKVNQPDKLYHFIVGIAGFLVVLLIAAVSGLAPLPAATVALVVVTIVAWGKERYDKEHPASHTWDGWDAYATVLGAVAAQALMVVAAGVIETAARWA